MSYIVLLLLCNAALPQSAKKVPAGKYRNPRAKPDSQAVENLNNFCRAADRQSGL
jgi:hypothetical protein